MSGDTRGLSGTAASARAAADQEAASASAAAADAAAAPESLLQMLKALVQELPGLLNDRVELLALEIMRARDALLQIALLTVAAAVLGVTSWLLLWAGVVMGLLALGLSVVWVLVLALGVNLLSVWWVVARARALLPRLGLPASRRHLKLKLTAPVTDAPGRTAPGVAGTAPGAVRATPGA